MYTKVFILVCLAAIALWFFLTPACEEVGLWLINWHQKYYKKHNNEE